MSEFHFLRPLWFLALLPAAWILIRARRGRAGNSPWRAVCDPVLLRHLWLEPPGSIPRLPLILLGLGWLLAVVTLAGPVWERQAQPVYRAQSARVLVLDLSASMDAADLAPSRLDRARFEIMDILARSQEGRTALVVFAGEPHLVTPLTGDTATVANLLQALSTGIIPAAGDAGAPGLRLAGDLLKRAGAESGEVLLITDGVQDPGAALREAHGLRKSGHRLSVLAVGTAAGAPVPGPEGGFAGMARLDAAPLQALAETGRGGFSLVTADDSDLTRLLAPPALTGATVEDRGSGVERWVERGPWLLPFLLLISAAGFRRGWIAGLLVAVLVPPQAEATEWRDLWLRPDQQGARALEQGKAAEAASRFRDPAWRGMALYGAGDYEAAAEAFGQGPGADAPYNRGNALARAGRLQEAIAAYREALELAPQHEDARANLALLEELLRQQQQQQQQQQKEPAPSEGQPTDQARDEGEQQGGANDASQGSEERGTEQGAEGQTPPEAAEAGREDRQAGAEAPPEGQQAAEQQAAGAPPGEATAGEEASDTGQQGPDEDSAESARQDVASQVEAAKADGDPADGGREDGSAESPRDRRLAARPSQQLQAPPSEADLALEQWLGQIPEDPAGLLRRKFMLEHLRRQREGGVQ